LLKYEDRHHSEVEKEIQVLGITLINQISLKEDIKRAGDGRKTAQGL
jgi:hypothetical protein